MVCDAGAGEDPGLIVGLLFDEPSLLPRQTEFYGSLNGHSSRALLTLTLE